MSHLLISKFDGLRISDFFKIASVTEGNERGHIRQTLSSNILVIGNWGVPGKTSRRWLLWRKKSK